MVSPRRAYRNPIWQAIHITELLLGSFIAGVLLAVLIWG